MVIRILVWIETGMVIMPNLSLKACQEFWSEYQDETVYRVTSFMESIEDWTIDTEEDDAIESAMQTLGETLEATGKTELKNPEKLIHLIAYVKMTRLLRVLQALDAANPGAASKVLATAEETATTNAAAEIFLHRNVVFERLRLLSRVFSAERIQTIQDALEEN